MSDRPRWDREGRGWPLAEHSRFVEAGGLRWHVQVMGTGPVMMLLHGTGAATHSWRGLAPLLSDRFTIVAPDLPEHGFTAGRLPGGLSLPAVAGAVAALADALKLRPRFLVAHSAGAAIATHLAIDEKMALEAIVGLGAALLPFPGIAGRLFPSLAKLLFVNPFAPHIFARIARIPGETARFLERSTGSHIDAAGAELYARLFAKAGHCAGAIGMMADWDLDMVKRDLPGLKVPLLLLHGDKDAAVPVSAARDAATLAGNARSIVLPGLGHLAHEERPIAVAEEILAFVGDGDRVGGDE